jgi:hypothetical protein
MHGSPRPTSRPLRRVQAYAQANDWMSQWLSVLQHLIDLDLVPERDASCRAISSLALEDAPAMGLAGTERRWQRPTCSGNRTAS